MSTIAEIEIPASEFALRETFRSLPDLDFEVERVVAHDHDRVMPFVWVESAGADVEEVERVLAGDPSVDNVRVLDDFGSRFLLQMDWIADIPLVHAIIDQGATILSANGTADEWILRVLFPDRELLSKTHEQAVDDDLTMEILNIYGLENNRHAKFGLTEEQHETLLAAFERGYFSVPRDITLNEFADELDVSHQALSERLRRAHYNLIKNGLVIGPDVTGDID